MKHSKEKTPTQTKKQIKNFIELNKTLYAREEEESEQVKSSLFKQRAKQSHHSVSKEESTYDYQARQGSALNSCSNRFSSLVDFFRKSNHDVEGFSNRKSQVQKRSNTGLMGRVETLIANCENFPNESREHIIPIFDKK